MKKYLLPCKCGQNVEVDAGRAGLSVSCPCGATLEVPTMRGLSSLQLVETPTAGGTSSGPEAAWGPGQGLLFLGTIVAICGVIALLLVLRTQPKWAVQTEQIAVDVDRLSTTELWERWQELRKGLVPAEDPVRQRYESDWATYYRRRTMAILPIGLGALLLVGGFALRSMSGVSKAKAVR